MARSLTLKMFFPVINCKQEKLMQIKKNVPFPQLLESLNSREATGLKLKKNKKML